MTLDTTPKRPWTPEDDARFAAMEAEGKRDADIAHDLGRTAGALTSRRKWLKRRGLSAGPVAPSPEQEPDDQPTVYANGNTWTPQDDAQLRELRTVGHDDHGIALLTGRTVAAVQARISNLKARGCGDEIPSHKRRSQWTPERVAEARSMRAEGMTHHQIARRLGTDAATVGRALRSPETVEDSPGEGVRVGRTVPDHNRTAADVEAARAALARAEARHREALDPVLAAVREAIHKAGYVDGPAGDDGDGVWPEPAWLVLDHLRSHGLTIRRAS